MTQTKITAQNLNPWKFVFREGYISLSAEFKLCVVCVDFFTDKCAKQLLCVSFCTDHIKRKCNTNNGVHSPFCIFHLRLRLKTTADLQ
jgi:hypothetical protein